METLKSIISKVIPESSFLTAAEVLENYKHIELTEEELNDAILGAKQKKEALLKHQEENRRVEANRRAMTSTGWDYDQTRNFMLYRSQTVFTGKFKIDKNNQVVYDLLCRYFSDDKDFVSMASAVGVINPSLEKGILLAGTFGTGKTWMMKLFQKNKKACYLIKNSKEIAAEFQVDGAEATNNYTNTRKNAYNDAAFFYQPFCGMCIDDMGTEEIKNSYGNKSNVIGDIIEMRYAAGNTGKYFHASTNMNAAGLIDFYGPRVVSRMREIFNIIELNGNDRRM